MLGGIDGPMSNGRQAPLGLRVVFRKRWVVLEDSRNGLILKTAGRHRGHRGKPEFHRDQGKKLRGVNLYPGTEGRLPNDSFPKHGSVNSGQFSVSSVTHFNCGNRVHREQARLLRGCRCAMLNRELRRLGFCRDLFVGWGRSSSSFAKASADKRARRSQGHGG